MQLFPFLNSIISLLIQGRRLWILVVRGGIYFFLTHFNNLSKGSPHHLLFLNYLQTLVRMYPCVLLVNRILLFCIMALSLAFAG